MKISLNLKIKNFINVKNFRLRLLSTVLLSLIFVTLFILGNPMLPVFMIFIFLAVLYEFNIICNSKFVFVNLINVFVFPLLLLFFLLFEINVISIPLKDNNYYYLVFILIALITNLFFYKIYSNIINFIMSNLLIISFFSLIKILLIPNGLNIFLYLVLLVSVMDIFAYIGGNVFGVKKIAPTISNGKTIEGTLIGLFFSILTSVLIRDLIDINFVYALILGFTIGLFSFFGDLLESFFKRRIGIKDSGKFIPGHGGFLDRFDGYILILPLFNLTLIF
ncbi:phosphatidate cytidylyltransferase [Candidatus Levibacter sp. Uisw_134_01]|uniref:phosphatidate cytidylyltransferase n=1 Tax=Candidatus Levibacter sp. Uisw_134_01 TaxID=3230999 RepID=UPI003D4E4451